MHYIMHLGAAVLCVAGSCSTTFGQLFDPSYEQICQHFSYACCCCRRPESSIAVVTHSTLLHYTLNSFGQEFAEPVQVSLCPCFLGAGEGGCYEE